MNGKRIFVSGGAGVIGLEMIPRLVARGAIVMVGDLKSRPKTLAPSVIYRQGDLNAMAAQELAQFKPDVFIHLAATFERSTESYEFWEQNFWHNVRLSNHLMTIAKDLPSLRRVVFASSYLIYDPALYQFSEAQSQAVALKESDPVLPRNLTGAAKFSHEIDLRFIDHFRSSQFTTVCARIYRGYGRNSRDVISRWVRELLRQQPITVYRPEGLFDYIYAADTAEGLIRLAEHEKETGIINLGTGRARRVQEVVDVLRQHFPDMVAHGADSDIPFEASQADMSQYLAHIGWSPVYTLETAIPEIIAFERQKLEAPVTTNERIPAVLVSSASRKIPLVRAMQQAARKLHPKAKVIAGDFSAAALSAHVADDFWCMPPTEDAHLADIIQGCKERGITVVLPTRDGELPFWAKHALTFTEAGIAVIVSPAASISLCVDKLAFADFGKTHALPFITTAGDIDTVTGATYVVKERFGAGARAIGLNLEKEAARAHAKTLKEPIVQPYVAGTEISIDAWLDKAHQVKGLVLRRRESLLNGESQVTTTFRDATIDALATQVLQALKLSGPVVLQAMITEGNQLQFIECNPRFGGASTTSIAAGLDSFYWSLLEAHGADVSSYVFARIPGEIRQVRVPSDLYFNVNDSHL
jgi:carbamoyl-phosphate synthase large subunit